MLDAGTVLLILLAIVIFIVPLLPLQVLKILYPICFTGIFLTSALSLERYKNLHMTAAFTLTALLMITLLLDRDWIRIASRWLQFMYFVLVVVSLIRQIASTKEVSKQVIMSAIAAYFLLGFAFIVMVTIVSIWVPGSYSLDAPRLNDPNMYVTLRDITYYTFVTYTTTGYGDQLPLHPVSKSLAILISSCGQLYIAIILAMLVGKYSSAHRK